MRERVSKGRYCGWMLPSPEWEKLKDGNELDFVRGRTPTTVKPDPNTKLEELKGEFPKAEPRRAGGRV